MSGTDENKMYPFMNGTEGVLNKKYKLLFILNTPSSVACDEDKLRAWNEAIQKLDEERILVKISTD